MCVALNGSCFGMIIDLIITKERENHKMNNDIENLKLAIQKKELGNERYSDQIKALSDPQTNALLEGILHNEIRHKAELEDHLDRLS